MKNRSEIIGTSILQIIVDFMSLVIPFFFPLLFYQLRAPTTPSISFSSLPYFFSTAQSSPSPIYSVLHSYNLNSSILRYWRSGYCPSPCCLHSQLLFSQVSFPYDSMCKFEIQLEFPVSIQTLIMCSSSPCDWIMKSSSRFS